MDHMERGGPDWTAAFLFVSKRIPGYRNGIREL